MLRRKLRTLNLVLTLASYLILALAPFMWFTAKTYGEYAAKEKTVPTNDYQDRVFAIHASQGFGTGWVVDIGLPELFVVTAAHVCSGEDTLYSTEWGAHSVIFQDQLRDTCLLTFNQYQEEFKRRGLEPLRFATVGPGILDSLCAISRRDPSQEKTICGNVISYSEVDIPEWGFKYNSIRHTAPTLPGASGGPILNERGEVACITTMIFLLEGVAPIFGECAVSSEVLYSISLNFSS